MLVDTMQAEIDSMLDQAQAKLIPLERIVATIARRAGETSDRAAQGKTLRPGPDGRSTAAVYARYAAELMAAVARLRS